MIPAPIPATVHLLHVGKTGGTALIEALRPVAEERGLVFHKHRVGLWDLPVDAPAILFLRDPVGRFVSAFNSRLRRGQPRYPNGRWSEAEAAAFAAFATPDALATALAQDDPAARAAMIGINRVRQPLTFWIDTVDRVRTRPGWTFIGRQERLAADFARLCEALDLPAHLALPTDAIAAHVTPPGMATDLSPAGRAAIARWYAADIALVEALAPL